MDAGGGDVGDRERVEDGLGVDLGAGGAEAGGEKLGQKFDAAGDFLEAGGAVIDGIHRGHHAEENLGGADVRRGLVAADVLLAGTEGETHGGVALGVFGNTDEPAGHLALEGVFRGEEAGVRSAEAEGNAEALGGADGDIGAEFAGGTQEGEREQIGGDDGVGAGGVGGGEEVFEVVDRAGGVGVLHEHAEAIRGGCIGAMVANDDRDAERDRAGLDDVDRLRVALFGNEEDAMGAGVAVFEAVTHHHGLGGGGTLVEHGGIGDFETGEIGDDRLKVEQRFEAALGYLGLVGRVGGIPAGVFEDGALDHTGGGGVVVTGADKIAENLVLAREPAEFGEGGGFAEGGGDVERGAADVRGHGGVDECIDRRVAEQREHGGGLGCAVAGVATGEAISGGEQDGSRRRHGTKK